MSTAAQLVRIEKFQSILSALALLNISGYMYPKEADVCDRDMYDYVVVGGGSAGVVIAARLAEANHTTLIIEAGGNPGLENQYPGLVVYLNKSRMGWNYTSESDGFSGQCHKTNGSILGKVLGGSGATNYMIYGRGFPRDYEKFSQVTNDSSWEWKNMLKYFKKSEKLQDIKVLKSAYGKYHSDKGTIGVMKENRPICDDYLKGFKIAGESVVVDNIGVGTLGYSSAFYNILNGFRTDGGSSYLPHLKNNPHLSITRNSLVTKILFDENKNAVGVEFVKNGKTVTAKARKEVIVTAGPIKSPQLLLLSGIGPNKELEKMKIKVISNLPVGKNLQNVAGTILVFRTNRTAKLEPFNAHNYPAPLIVGYSALNKTSRDPNYETLNFIIDDAEFFLSFCGFAMRMKNSICDKFHLQAGNSQRLVTIVKNINPKSRGEITLKSTNPFVQPKIVRGYYSDDDDLDAIVDYVMDYTKIQGTPHFRGLRLELLKAVESCNKFKFGSKPYWRCYALCMTVVAENTCGACSMGSVVDTKLKVMGVNRLRVAGASVMPNLIGSSIYASVVALAEKAAEMIMESG